MSEVSSQSVGNKFYNESSSSNENLNSISEDEFREFLFYKFRENSNTHININDPKLKHCFMEFVKDYLDPDKISGCPVKFDGISCWLRTPLGVLSTIPCFAELNGIAYDTTGK